MSQHQVLGTCPKCNATIDGRNVLIEYTRSGDNTQYAECPACRAVVRPETA